ncbi:hypothetical protein J7M22_08295 [Candidatus Poribacteria bacterium]|nr:hypothetical protein [Candidatus Poribacteria bacterium]
MTLVHLKMDNCNFNTTITAQRIGEFEVKISIESECDSIQSLQGMVERISIDDIWARRPPLNLECHSKLKHPSCAFPVALAKAVEVELGLALPGEIILKSERIDG